MECRDARTTVFFNLELRRRVTEVITEKVMYLLSLRYEDGVRWKGSKADLLELIHEVYVHGDIKMPDRCHANLTYLVRTCFANLGLMVMKNVHSHVRRAAKRKGIRSGRLVEHIREMVACNMDLDKQLWNELIDRP